MKTIIATVTDKLINLTRTVQNGSTERFSVYELSNIRTAKSNKKFAGYKYIFADYLQLTKDKEYVIKFKNEYDLLCAQSVWNNPNNPANRGKKEFEVLKLKIRMMYGAKVTIEEIDEDVAEQEPEKDMFDELYEDINKKDIDFGSTF